MSWTERMYELDKLIAERQQENTDAQIRADSVTQSAAFRRLHPGRIPLLRKIALLFKAKAEGRTSREEATKSTSKESRN